MKIASIKLYQTILEYIQFLFKKRFHVNEKYIFSIKKIINVGNYIYDYAQSFFDDDF